MRWALYICLLSISSLYATLVGNPESPFFSSDSPWVSVRLEYEKEYINNLNLQFHSGRAHQRVQDASCDGNFFNGAINIARYITFYGKGGAVSPSFDFAVTNGNGVTTHLQTTPKEMLSWGVGTKILLFHRDHASLAIEGSYFRVEPEKTTLFSFTSPNSSSPTNLSWYTWQISMGLSYQVCSTIPYMGLKFSRTIVTFLPETTTLVSRPFKMENRRQFGLFLGCTLIARQYIDLNLEGRLVDENALSGTLVFRF